MSTGWGFKALVHRADSSHVYWTGVSLTKVGNAKPTEGTSFPGLVSEDYVFEDLIRRGIVVKADKSLRNKSDWVDDESWERIQLALTSPFIFSQDGGLYRQHEPEPHFWYQIDIDGIGKENVSFDITFGGYKDRLVGITLPLEAFYLCADRLKARIRFRSDWSSLDEVVRAVGFALKFSPSLTIIRDELQMELERLASPSPQLYQSVYRNVLAMLERLLRSHHERTHPRTGRITLNGLITGLASQQTAPSDLIQMLELVRPYRNYSMHGRQLEPPVAKVVLATALDVISRLADHFDGAPRAAGD